MPTQLVVELLSRLRDTTPRVRREIALGAGTALALSALAVALGVVLTGLVVFPGSWPGFAPGTSGGEATLATATSRNARDTPAPARRPAAPSIVATPISFPTPAARTPAPARRAHKASHHRRVDRVRRQTTPRRTTSAPSAPSTPAPAAAAPAPAAAAPATVPSQSVIVTPAAPVQSQSVAPSNQTAATTKPSTRRTTTSSLSTSSTPPTTTTTTTTQRRGPRRWHRDRPEQPVPAPAATPAPTPPPAPPAAQAAPAPPAPAPTGDPRGRDGRREHDGWRGPRR